MSIEKTISQFIENQFPDYYQENGENFVDFVTEYYKWLETDDGMTYHARRLQDYQDVDSTVDEFLVYFKTKYLPYIQFETDTDTKKLVKKALDLYRSKGTERSIDLFFKIVFGTPAEVYYPGDDIFKLSSAKWVKQNYLEVSSTPVLVAMIGKQIRGLRSGATAFVERSVRRKIESKWVDVLFISSVNGDFISGEKVYIDGKFSDKAPTVLGSLTSFDILSGGRDFRVGEIVEIFSENGVGARARVRGVSNVTGIVDFELIHSGWGYTANAEILISERVLTVSNLQVSDTNTSNAFNYFETIVQPLANIEYAAANASFSNGQTMYSYYGNSAVKSTLIILTAANSSATNGSIFVSYQGNLTTGLFYTSGNSAVANAVTITDLSASANVISTGANGFLYTTNNIVQFQPNTYIFQTNSTGYEVANAYVISAVYSGLNTDIFFDDLIGIFRNNLILRNRYANGVLTAANASVNSITVSVGVFDINNDFTTLPNNYVYGNSAMSNGTITKISRQTALAGFAISANSLSYTQNILFYSDPIAPYANVLISATTFQPGALTTNLASSNSGTTLIDAFANQVITVGGINNLEAINPGSGYDTAPMISIYEPMIAPAGRKDFVVQLSGITGTFNVGELVLQNSVNVGIVKELVGSDLRLYRITYENPFIDGYTIDGIFSGASGTVVRASEEGNNMPIGLNAIVVAEVQSDGGVVTGLDIIDSGYGYLHNETVTFVANDSIRAGSAVGYLGRQGIDRGYHKDRNGYLSDTKFLFDGNYYQEYSYEIRTTATLDRYEEMLKNVMHVSGSKFFGAVVSDDTKNVPFDLAKNITTIEGTFSATLINSSNSVVTSNTVFLRVGDNIAGTGIPANTIIASITNSSFMLSKNATTSATVTLTYQR